MKNETFPQNDRHQALPAERVSSGTASFESRAVGYELL